MFKQTIMLADKSGLREKGSTVPVKPIAKDTRAENEIKEEQYQAQVQNIGKMLKQGVLSQSEAADAIRRAMEKKNKG